MDKDQDNVIAFRQKPDMDNRTSKAAKVLNNQSNPMYKTLFKFIHTRFNDDKTGKPFSRFEPKDLF